MFKIILAVILLINHGAKVEAKLKLVNVVFRHGDRAPDDNGQELYPNDPYVNNSFWPYSLGGLNNLGKSREYQLGKYLKARYGDFLGEYYLPKTVYARSTNVDRTKMSLQIVLAALFPPPPEQKWNVDLDWQPIPTNYVTKLDDNLMIPEECPKYLKAREQVETSAEFRAELSQLNDFMKYLTQETGKNITNSNDMYFLWHALRAEQSMGLKLPPFSDSIFPNGSLLRGILLEYKIFSYNREMRRLNGGMLLRKFIENMVNYISRKISHCRKILLYSGHETNIAALLQALGVFEPIHVPQYSSAVIIELHEENDKHFVKVVYYKGIVEEGPIDEIKQIRGCDTLCPLNRFRSLLRTVIPSKEDMECDKRSLKRGIERNQIKLAKGILEPILNAIYKEEKSPEEL